jgi:hypothetical protein
VDGRRRAGTAAGNGAWPDPGIPPAYAAALSVGATAEDGRLTSYSTRGTWVKLAAPACAPTTQLGSGFGAGCGTSGATGYSGVWAGAPLELAYRWLRCSTAKCIRATTVATTRAYRVLPADLGYRLRLAITAKTGTRTIRAASSPTRAVRR